MFAVSLLDIFPANRGNSLDQFSASMLRLMLLVVLPSLVVIGTGFLARSLWARRKQARQRALMEEMRRALAGLFGGRVHAGGVEFVQQGRPFRIVLDSDGTAQFFCGADALPEQLCWNSPLSLMNSHTDWSQRYETVSPPAISGARSWMVIPRDGQPDSELRVDFWEPPADPELTVRQLHDAVTLLQSGRLRSAISAPS